MDKCFDLARSIIQQICPIECPSVLVFIHIVSCVCLSIGQLDVHIVNSNAKLENQSSNVELRQAPGFE